MKILGSIVCRFDILVIIVSMGLTGGSFYLSAVGRGSSDNLYVAIESQEGDFYLPIWEDEELILNGPIGETVVAVKDNKAFIVRSDCRDKIGISMGKISKTQQWVACLPNKVFFKIVPQRNKTEQVDTSAY